MNERDGEAHPEREDAPEADHPPSEPWPETPAEPPPPVPSQDWPEPEEPAAPRTAPEWHPPERPRWQRREVWVLIVILLLGGGVRFVRLGEPSKLLPRDHEQCREVPPLYGGPCWEMIPLDERHYVPDARDVIRYGTEADTRVPPDDGAYVVHPPAGKWFIAAGIAIFGDHPFGWRFFGAVFATIGILALYMLARALWRSAWWAALAAVLLAADGLWFVQSRVAMLDIYAATFVLLGAWLVVEDRERTAPDHRGLRWYRIGAAASFALAFATKWSVLPFIVVALGMCVAWEIRKARLAEHRKGLRRALAMAGTFAVLPSVLYAATFVPWFTDDKRYIVPPCDRDVFGWRVTSVPSPLRLPMQWACWHGEALSFHRTLAKYERVKEEDRGTTSPAGRSPTETPTVQPESTPGHPYFGHGYSWPWLGRPVAHWYDEPRGKTAREVLGLPNPAIWWPGFLVLPLIGFWALRRRDEVAAYVLAFATAGYLPALAADAVGRPLFLFYATPLVPFLVLGLTHVLVRIRRRWESSVLLAPAYGALAVLVFAYFYPVLAGHPIPKEGILGWDAHMWFAADCTGDRIKLFCWI